MSFSPQTGLVYLSASDNSLVYAPDTDFEPSRLASNLGIDLAAGFAQLGPNATAGLPSGSRLIAWDPVAQREAWRADAPPGGVLSTAGGLVFAAAGSDLVAYRATDGERLWSAPAQTGVVAAPVTFELGGEQYVAVVAGRASGDYYASNHSRLLVFKRGGTAELPPVPSPLPRTLNPPPATAPAEVVAHGEALYEQFCIICHGDIRSAGGLFRRGMFPELIYSGALADEERFSAIVEGGLLSGAGMASFDAALDDGDVDALRAYLIDAANAVKAEQAAANPADGRR
jgi:mono/diheme cytochrome c family protein